MSRPRLADLYCKAGGAAMGYHRAGFDVVGVDIEPQPNYPFEFHQADALTFSLEGFDVAHASPPCQYATDYVRTGMVKDSPNLIPPTRDMLLESGLPYVIENVYGARADLIEPVTICGCSLGMDIRRHRLFESNVMLMVPPCACGGWMPGQYPSSTGRKPLSRRTIEVGSWDIPYAVQAEAMGVDWKMTLPELSNAIPPAYTELLGAQLLAYCGARSGTAEPGLA